MRHFLRFIAGAILLLPFLAAGAGLLMRGFLHPMRRPLDPALIQQAGQLFQQAGATREDMLVRAPDGVLLRGWKVRPQAPNGDWVLLFHGVSDNRAGMLPYAAMLLRHGYSVVMMDARAHGESGGVLATFGWQERYDTRTIVNALYDGERRRISLGPDANPNNIQSIFALGESMGAAIALQSAALEPRIAGVVAESSFRNLREVAYDYAGLEAAPWLGKTLFRPAVWTSLPGPEREGGFKADDVSPEKAVAARAFPVLLICDGADNRIPCRHSRSILNAAIGPKELWEVPGAPHTGAYGTAPSEFEQRVITFFETHRAH